MENKRKIVIGLSILAVIVLIGGTLFALSDIIFKEKVNFSNNEGNELTQIVEVDNENTFVGTIIGKNVNIATIKVSQGDVLSSSSKINIDLKGNNFSIGDKVMVKYSGYIMETYPAMVEVESIQKIKLSKTAELYTMLIDDIMKRDDALNYEMKYLALDINSFVPLDVEEPVNHAQSSMHPKLNEEDRQDIINYAYMYTDDVKIGSLADLEEQGVISGRENDFFIPYIEGVAIYATKFEKINDNTFCISLTKYKSGLAAIFPDYKATYKDGKWTIEVTAMAIS